MLNSLAKMVKTMLPPDAISDAASSIVQSAIDYKNSLPLQPGEVAAIAVAYEVEGVAYAGVAFVDDDNKLVRFENVKPVGELVTELIKKM